jgi:hypothetical protein
MIKSGREREAAEIVRFKRAAAVGRLLLGELDGPMEPIFKDQHMMRRRSDLRAERDAIREYLRSEVAKFCRQNFENVEPEDLAKWYKPIFEHESNFHLPLIDFTRDFGKFRTSVLNGSPPHSTVHVSTWGLQFDFPERHLMHDLATTFNEAVKIESRLIPYRTKTRREQKQQKTRAEIADLIRRENVSQRACILSCFNLIEAYINGIAWDYVQLHDISGLSKDNRNVLTESERLVNIIDKLIKIPRIVTEREESPLHQTRDPLKSFIDIVKPYRDSIVHASPFAAAEKFGGYDKLRKLYDLNLTTVSLAVDITITLIKDIHKFINISSDAPIWILSRSQEDGFIFKTEDREE